MVHKPARVQFVDGSLESDRELSMIIIRGADGVYIEIPVSDPWQAQERTALFCECLGYVPEHGVEGLDHAIRERRRNANGYAGSQPSVLRNDRLKIA